MRSPSAPGASLAAAPGSDASTLVDRGASAVSLKANGRGVALITYRRSGATRRVLAWGAISMGRLAHRLDYSGQRKGVGNWRSFRTTCGPYTGPALPYATAACTLPGSARTGRCSSGRASSRTSAARPAPWSCGSRTGRARSRTSRSTPTGPSTTTPAGRHHHHLFGRYTYQGRPIFGKRSTPSGAPLDGLGRNIYVESLDSDMGAGWRRVNGFLARSPRGQFCFEFAPRPGTRRTPAARGRPVPRARRRPLARRPTSWSASPAPATATTGPGTRG